MIIYKISSELPNVDHDQRIDVNIQVQFFHLVEINYSTMLYQDYFLNMDSHQIEVDDEYI
jgi:hypothetical protein